MTFPKLMLIVDDRRLARWQIRALEQVPGLGPLTVLSCTNTRIRRRLGKHFFYYVLRWLAFARTWSAKSDLAATSLPLGGIVDFESEHEGAWQRLPASILDRIRSERPVAVIKFGMGLLRVPPDLGAPILSFHHGDPDHYRGRPAGFYETLEGRGTMGQVVQILSDRLDAGAVVAEAATAVVPHSYRATLRQAYDHSPFLLREALRNLAAGRRIPKSSNGRNCRLPGNATVVRFVLRLGSAAARRLWYLAAYEKRWRVSAAPADPAMLDGAPFPARAEWREVPRLAAYTFYADPFPYPDPPGLIVEAMNRRTGTGELVFVGSDGGQRRISAGGGHFSYPATVEDGGRTFLVPEVCGWSPPRIHLLGPDGLEEVALLDVEGSPRIADPTFCRHQGRLYLFGNKAELGSNALHIWSSDSLFGRFVEHPRNPVLISPRGGRMAGQLVRRGDGLFRVGQDSLRGYGDGVLVFRVERLTPETYAETLVRDIRFERVRGPHTLNWADGEILFDWYQERFAPLAWLRRLRARL